MTMRACCASPDRGIGMAWDTRVVARDDNQAPSAGDCAPWWMGTMAVAVGGGVGVGVGETKALFRSGSQAGPCCLARQGSEIQLVRLFQIHVFWYSGILCSVNAGDQAASDNGSCFMSRQVSVLGSTLTWPCRTRYCPVHPGTTLPSDGPDKLPSITMHFQPFLASTLLAMHALVVCMALHRPYLFDVMRLVVLCGRYLVDREIGAKDPELPVLVDAMRCHVMRYRTMQCDML